MRQTLRRSWAAILAVVKWPLVGVRPFFILLGVAAGAGVLVLPGWFGVTFGLAENVRIDLAASLIGGAVIGAAVLGAELAWERRSEKEGLRRERQSERASLRLQPGMGTKFPGIDLRGKDLSGFYLHRKDLSGADLTGAVLVDADLTGAKLSGADLTGAKLIWADLGADLSEVDPRSGGANLLLGANLTGADLTGALLVAAVLTDANLTDATMPAANNNALALVRWDPRYPPTWPEGFDPPPNDWEAWVRKVTLAATWPEGFDPPPNAAAGSEEDPPT